MIFERTPLYNRYSIYFRMVAYVYIHIRIDIYIYIYVLSLSFSLYIYIYISLSLYIDVYWVIHAALDLPLRGASLRQSMQALEARR